MPNSEQKHNYVGTYLFNIFDIPPHRKRIFISSYQREHLSRITKIVIIVNKFVIPKLVEI